MHICYFHEKNSKENVLEREVIHGKPFLTLKLSLGHYFIPCKTKLVKRSIKLVRLSEGKNKKAGKINTRILLLPTYEYDFMLLLLLKPKWPICFWYFMLCSLCLTWYELSYCGMSHRSCDFSMLWLLIDLFLDLFLSHQIFSYQTPLKFCACYCLISMSSVFWRWRGGILRF